MSNSKGDVFMNRIFKVIWSKTKHCYIVVSEYAKANTKAAHTGLRTTAAAVAAAAMLLAPVNYNYVWAADTATVTDTNNEPQTVYPKDGADSTLEKETKAREAADAEIKQSMTDQKTDTALHVSKDGNLIVGTKEKQTVKDLKIRGQMASNSISTGAITATGDATVKGKVEAEAVYDDTTKTGNYVVQTNSVGANLSALDTQVKSNADAIKEEAQKRKYSVTNLEKADAAEAAVREAADTKLNTALAKETADRLGADAAQDKVIKQVNDNLVASVNTINESVKNTNENMAAGFTALSQADANEAATREAADTEIKQAMTDQKTSTALHISSSGDLIVGTKENQTVKDMKIRGKLASGSISTGDIISSGNVTVAGKMAADGVTDETTKDGTYIKQNNTVGNNLVSLDTQVKANADAVAEKANATDVYTKAETDQKVDAANTYTYRKVAAEEKAREAADTELNERITNEANAIHDEIKAGDKALDDRITNVKEYLEGQTADNYVSKADAAVQDGAIVKADKTMGENVTNLDAALAKETAARIGADAAQDKVIQQVNDNLVQSVNTINKNMADGFTALNQADANEAKARAAADEAETAARVGADTKLAEAANSGLSLSDSNVLQRNKTTIDAQGNVTTSRTDANEMILNKGNGNQITLNEKGIKVGTNSSVMDKDGVYTGGDTYSEAKAALKSDGSIKGADGKFTVDGTNGNVNTKGSVTAASGTIGNVSMSSDGTMTGVKDLTASGKITANSFTDGTATMSNGSLNGVNQINATGNIVTTGNMKTHDITAEGTIKGETINGTTGTFGSLSTTGNASVGGTLTTNGIANTGNATTDTLTVNYNATVGGNLGVTGDITGKSLNVGTGDIKGGQITGTGLDVGAGTIKTTGAVETGTLHATGNATVDGNTEIKGTLKAGATTVDSLDAGSGTIKTTGAVETGTLNTTGDAEIGGKLTTKGDAEVGGDLTVKGKLNVEEINLMKNGIVGDNNVTASTKIAAGELTGYQKATSTKDGSETESAFDYDANGTSTWAKSTAADNSWKKSTLSVEGDGVKSTAIDSDNNKNTATQSAAESSSVLSNKEGLSSTFKQNVSEILNEIHVNDTKYAKLDQKADNITSEVKAGDNTTSATQTATDLTNTAKNGTITNDAKNLVNKASGNMTNTVGGKLLNDVTGDMENKVGGSLIDTIMGTSTTTVTGNVTEDYKSDLTTKVGGNETHAVTGNQTVTVSKDRTVNVKGTETENFNAQVTNVKTDQKTSVGGNQTTIVTGNQQNTVSGNKLETVKGAVTEKYGSQATTIDGNQSTNVGGNQSNVVAGDQTNNISGSKTETVRGAVSETYGSQTTKVNGDQSTTVTGKQTNSITGDQVNTIGGNQTTTVTGDSSLSAKNITNTGTESVTHQVGSHKVLVNTEKVESAFGDNIFTTRDESGITNTAKNGTISNTAKDILNDASGDIINMAAGEIGNTATKITNITGDTTVTSDTNGTVFENKSHNKPIDAGTITKTTISGNTLETGKATMDYAEVMKDLGVRGNAVIDQTLTVKGDSDLQGNAAVGKDLTVKGNSDFQGDATVGKNLTVKGDSDFQGNATVGKDLAVKGDSDLQGNATVGKDLTVGGISTFHDKVTVTKGGLEVTGGTQTDTLHVTGASNFDGMATFKDIVTMEKDLSVGGSATVTGDVTAKSYKVGDKTYIDENGINANGQKITHVAAGTEDGDAANYGQLRKVETRMDGVENRVTNVESRVDKMDSRIDKVGANAAAMANLHPLEFDEDSKWNVAAAVGNYKSETAAAVGAFYRPNEDVMFNLSTTFGNDENMVGGGLSLRLGKGGNHEKDKKLKAAIAENNDLRVKVDDLTARMDALLSVLNPNMSKEFPDVPENHWAYEAVTRLAGSDIVQGYEDGKFHGERTMTRYEMAEIIYNALSKGAKAEKKLVEEFRPELQAMAAQKQAK